MHTSASASNLLVLNAYWAGLSFMWNALHPIVLPALLVRLVPDESKNTYLGLLTFAGLLVAMVLQPVSGALSDRWISRYGRRRPLMVIGTLFDCVFLVILGLSGGFAWLLVGYVGLQVSSNTAQGPLQGLLRDRVPPHQLGVASSIKVFLDLMSLVAASLVAGRLMDTGARGTSLVMLVIPGLLLAFGAITILFTHEESTMNAGGHHRSARVPEEPYETGANAGYWWLIAERAAFLFGVYGLQAFGQYYLQDALLVPNPPQQAGNLLALIGLGTIALVVAGGWLADRFGPKRLLYAASGLAGLGMLLMVLTTDLRELYVIGSIVGAGIGLFLASNWALANRIAPPAQAGRFLGLTNLATAGAAALARLEGPAVDLLNAARPEAWWGYKGIFVFGALCILLSTWFLAKVK
ncbi:MAG: MFS transporter [Chloroflexota bacterium]